MSTEITSVHLTHYNSMYSNYEQTAGWWAGQLVVCHIKKDKKMANFVVLHATVRKWHITYYIFKFGEYNGCSGSIKIEALQRLLTDVFAGKYISCTRDKYFPNISASVYCGMANSVLFIRWIECISVH